MKTFGKREIERYNLKVPARMAVHNKTTVKSDETVYYLTTRNICSGGVYLSTDQKLQLGAVVDIAMQLTLNIASKVKHKCSYVQISGQVIRIDDSGIAIQFDRCYKIVSGMNGQML